MTSADQELLALFDREVRQSLVPPVPGWVTERVGRVVRTTPSAGATHGSYVEWSDLDERTADAVIAEQVAHFERLGRRFEWKTYGHDQPGDLPARLLAAGFVAEDEEALVIGPVAAVLDSCRTANDPEGVHIRTVEDRDWDGIAALHSSVWGRESEEWVSGLVAEVRSSPERISVFVADAGGQVVCAAWVRFHEGTHFASLWGGSTLEEWRRRGIYRAIVRERALLAAARGFPYLQVDASPDSRPILERLGLRTVSTTTPYVWTPAQAVTDLA